MENTQILIVEDERITAEDIRAALKGVGYEVPDLVSSGEEAVKKAGELRPDLVLMDIRLEGNMDGIEAAEQIKERYNIPVIYLTAYSDTNTMQRAKMTDPSGYILKEPFGFIRKPFKEGELHTAIELTLYKDKIEKKLRNYEQWLPAILKSINDAVIATDSEGQIKFMNPVAENITGWMQEDAIGENLDEVFKILNELPAISRDSKNIAAGSFGKTIITSKDGIEKHVNGSFMPIKDKSGNIDGLIVVFQEILS